MNLVGIRRLLVVLLVCAAPAQAQEAPKATATDEQKAAASSHFQAGIALAQRGALAAAIGEFEAAYAASPHYSVLYNIAQTEVARGRFVQAVAAFERYLVTGDKEIADDRRKVVLDLIDRYKKNIGALELELTAPGRTRVWVDGNELRGDELTHPIALSAGPHSLIGSTGGSEPSVQEVVVRGQQTTKARIDSLEVASQTNPSAALADCRVKPERLPSRASAGAAQVQAPPPSQHEQRQRARQKTLAYALGGSGVAMVLAGGGLAWWNQGRFEALNQGQPNGGNPDPNRVVAIQRIDDLSMGLITVGTGLLIGGLWSYFAGEESH
jgi:hypothetical protein